MSKKAKSAGPPKRMVARNRRARFDYEILDVFEAGMSLRGSEVKTLRSGKGTIAEGYVRLKDGSAFLTGATIPEYPQASYNNHVPQRSRRLLLSKAQLKRLHRATTEKGLSIIPMALYFSGSLVKLEIGLGRGKKQHDKRETLKNKQAKREAGRDKRYR